VPKLKLGKKGKLLAAAVIIFIAIVLIGALFFPVPQPKVHLSANYGGANADGEPYPVPFLKLGPIYVTNSLIAAWVTVLVLVVFFFLATRKMKLVPKGLQNLAEIIVEMLLGFVENIAGKENGRRFFPIIATIFLFVVTNAWMGLLPVFNVIGRLHPESVTNATLLNSLVSIFPEYTGRPVDVPFLRPANTDINVPLMLALVSFCSVEYWGITALGFRHYMSKFLRVQQMFQGIKHLIKGKIKPAIMDLVFGFIDAFVGALELLSEFVRILSFTFRLFGNMTAGEVLILMISFLIPWGLASIFYGLETLLGFIQALIFSTLTLVFATMAVAKHEADH
jgi:F-type H+-transporting ATPase subunit a